MVAAIEAALDIVRRVTSPNARSRENAANEVTDVLSSLGALGPVVAGVLVLARLAESDRDAQEAQLHALAEMHEWGLVPAEHRQLVAGIRLDASDPAQEEYLDYLLDRS